MANNLWHTLWDVRDKALSIDGTMRIARRHAKRFNFLDKNPARWKESDYVYARGLMVAERISNESMRRADDREALTQDFPAATVDSALASVDMMIERMAFDRRRAAQIEVLLSTALTAAQTARHALARLKKEEESS